VQQSDTITRLGPAAADTTDSTDAKTLLAAAVTATLIEYQRLVAEPNDNSHPTSETRNWRMIACWERLRGRA
jgi:hypothetical protein